MDALAKSLHSLARAPSAANPNPPARVISLANRLDRHVNKMRTSLAYVNGNTPEKGTLHINDDAIVWGTRLRDFNVGRSGGSRAGRGPDRLPRMRWPTAQVRKALSARARHSPMFGL
jgi:hypothetical protein